MQLAKFYVQFFKQGPAYKKEGPDPNKGSNQHISENIRQKARLILQSGIYYLLTNISEGTAFLLQGVTNLTKFYVSTSKALRYRPPSHFPSEQIEEN